MGKDSRRRVRFTAPGEVDVVTEAVPAPGPDEVRVCTKYSAISPGTERLVYRGNVPDGLDTDLSIEALQGDDFSYPISYGYACVGEVEDVGQGVDNEWEGASVFAFQPHVSRFLSSTDALVRLPDAVAFDDAVMIPSLETAVNLIMDGRPMIGEHVLIFGQGAVGLLTARLLADHPLATLVAVDPLPSRRERSDSMGATAVESISELEQGARFEMEPTSAPPQHSDAAKADLVYELTGRPAVLNDAVRCTGFAGRLVVGSWYGTKTAPIELGGHFHRSRMRVVSSQVSTIDPTHRGRWTKDRRMSVVLEQLNEVKPSQLISNRFDVEEAPSVYDTLAADRSMLQPVFVHE